MSGRAKRRAAIESVDASGRTIEVRPKIVMAIILSLIECGRVAAMRYNDDAEAVQTAKAAPSVKFSLPWTGTGNLMSIPQGQQIIYLTRDPTNCMMYYDYNNGGAAGIAQVGNYQWNSTAGNGSFTILSANTNLLRPCWATYSAVANGKAFHGNILFSRTFNDRTYMQCDAPPGNASSAVSNVTVVLPGGQATVQVGDIFEIGFYRYANGVDALIQSTTTTLANTATQNLGVFTVSHTDVYRVQLNWTSLNGANSQCIVNCAQTWACGTLCCNPLPQLNTIWQSLNRVRILGANVDVVNQTPEQFRGGSVVATQLSAGTSQYYAMQGVSDPYTYISSLRGVEAVDMAKGRFGYLKPDGDTAFTWKRPFMFDGNGTITFQRSPVQIENGYVAIAISAPDLVSSAGTTTTTRGQVTLDFRFSIEIDSVFTWLDYDDPIGSSEEWEAAERAVAHIPQFWEDPDWGKIWSAIKSGARIGTQLLGLVPDPRFQAVSRGGTRVLNVLDQI